MTTLFRILRASVARGFTLAALLLLAAAHANAADFEVRTASMGLYDGYWSIDARIDYRLSEEAVEALENGVTLTLELEIDIRRLRNWWLDEGVVSTTRDWQLSFEPLSRRYVVRYPDEREPTSHASLFGALNAIGRVQRLPVAPATALGGGNDYRVALRALLSEQTLPAALQFLAFWDGGLSLQSEWYEWMLSP
jgi:hypothetical protein